MIKLINLMFTVVTLFAIQMLAYAQQSCMVLGLKTFGNPIGSFNSDKTLIDTLKNVNGDFRISAINYCYKTTGLLGIGTLISLQTQIKKVTNDVFEDSSAIWLNMHGTNSILLKQCDTWYLKPTEEILGLSVSFNPDGVTQVAMQTASSYMVAGASSPTDQTRTLDFNFPQMVVIGLQSYDQGTIQQFGVIQSNLTCGKTTPYELVDIPQITNASQIGLSWQPPYGGAKSYEVLFDQGQKQFTTLIQDYQLQNLTVLNLVQGVTYQFKVRAINAKGNLTDFSNTVSILAAQVPDRPLAPTTQLADNNVTLRWQAPNNGGSNITGYNLTVQRKDGVFQQTSTFCNMTKSTQLSCQIPLSVLTASPFNLTIGSTVNAKVVAANAYGYSAQSSVGSGAVVSTLPDTPTALSENVLLRTNSSLGLTWIPGITDAGIPNLDYTINVTSQKGQILYTSVNTYFQVPNLLAGVNYTFSVQARNQNGLSNFSQVLKVNLIFSPDAPFNLRNDVTYSTDTVIRITFTAPNTNGGSIINYTIWFDQGNSSFVKINTVNTFYTTTQTLVAGNNYTFQVQAQNSFGVGPLSQPIVILAATKPDPPLSVSTSNIQDQVQITWQAPNQHGSPITQYKVFVRSNTSLTQIPCSFALKCNISLQTLQQPPYHLTYLQNVSATIIATNLFGDSDYSSVGSGALIYQVPNEPVITTVQQQFDTIVINWVSPAFIGGTPIIDYQIDYCNSDCSGLTILQSNLISTTYSTTYNFSRNTNQTFTVVARNAVGYSAKSKSVSITTFDVPQAPINLNAVNYTNNRVNLTWSSPLNNGGTPIIQYIVNYAETTSIVSTLYSDIGSINSLAVLGLTANTTYKFTMQAENQIGVSALSQPIIVQTLARDPSISATTPSSPLRLKNIATISNASQIGLSWQAPIDDGGFPVIDYTLWSDSGMYNFFSPVAYNITQTSYIQTGLIKSLAYQFKVTARNAIGQSPFSQVISVTAAQVAAQPDAPQVTTKDMVATIQWIAPDNGGSSITGYIVTFAESDQLTFTKDKVNCDTQRSNITSCIMPLNSLMAAPFYLTWGSQITAKVIAINAYGESQPSSASQSVVMLTSPSAPLNLAEDATKRSITNIGLMWSQPLFLGGAEVVDYRIMSIQEDGTISTVADNVNTTDYTVTNLITGYSYQFYAQARNSNSYSQNSNILELLCATIPSQPDQVQVKNSGDSITVVWSASQPNGSPILNYQVSMVAQNGQSVPIACKESNKSTQCTIDLSELINQLNSFANSSDAEVQIVAVNSVGNSLPSIGTAVMSNYHIPQPPINMQVAETVLSWNQTQNGGADVLYYTVWWDQGNETWVQVKNTTETSSSIDHIQGQYKTTATNAIGTSGFSESVSLSKVIQGSIASNPSANYTAVIIAVIVALVVVGLVVAGIVVCIHHNKKQNKLVQVIPETEISQQILINQTFNDIEIQCFQISCYDVSIPQCLAENGIISRQDGLIEQSICIASVVEMVEINQEIEDKHLEQTEEVQEGLEETLEAIAVLPQNMQLNQIDIQTDTDLIQTEPILALTSTLEVRDESQDLHSILYPQNIESDLLRYDELENDNQQKEVIETDKPRYEELENDISFFEARQPPSIIHHDDSGEFFMPIKRERIESIEVSTISQKPYENANYRMSNNSYGNYTNVTKATMKDSGQDPMMIYSNQAQQITKVQKSLSQDRLLSRPKNERLIQSQPIKKKEDLQPDADEIMKMIQNLWEKKALGAMTPLDKQLLKKLIKLVKNNPKNYGKKVGYLQLLYM